MFIALALHNKVIESSVGHYLLL